MAKLRENWFLIVFTMLVSLGGSVLLSNYNNRDLTIKNAAPKEYVDKQDDLIKEKITEQKTRIEKELDKKADKDVVKDIKDELKAMKDVQKVMDSRLYDLWKDMKRK